MQVEIITKVAMSPELLKNKEILVRCKDCRYGVKAKNGLKQDVIECNNSDLSMMGDCHFPNWYCADGEPKDGEKE